jgi:hypothetical protein
MATSGHAVCKSDASNGETQLPRGQANAPFIPRFDNGMSVDCTYERARRSGPACLVSTGAVDIVARGLDKVTKKRVRGGTVPQGVIT